MDVSCWLCFVTVGGVAARLNGSSSAATVSRQTTSCPFRRPYQLRLIDGHDVDPIHRLSYQLMTDAADPI
jgi:hypothetical protein